LQFSLQEARPETFGYNLVYETWCLHMIPKTNDKVFNGNSRHFHEPRELAISKTQMKTMIIAFFDIKSTVHFEFIPKE
jgi:hypothetical protein